MYIEWTKKYETGIDKIDEQHMKLVDLINDLYDKVVLKKDVNAVKEAILDLKLYTIFHFTTEEKMFGKYKYIEDEHKDHVAGHKAFTDEIAKYMTDEDSSQFELGYRLVEYLKKWLFGHILVSDMKFATFMKHNHFTEISADDISFDDDD
jgi:hemerythrin-like metal-binding protein